MRLRTRLSILPVAPAIQDGDIDEGERGSTGSTRNVRTCPVPGGVLTLGIN